MTESSLLLLNPELILGRRVPAPLFCLSADVFTSLITTSLCQSRGPPPPTLTAVNSPGGTYFKFTGDFYDRGVLRPAGRRNRDENPAGFPIDAGKQDTCRRRRFPRG